ncbi:zinc finger protein 879 [Chrysoperla carnea]|uniref:zinc finger protein 879 n=1 Tax=Chrysoperla carnea TaxID=189513 RepID=UPI001D077841|nr:zinc finger protein 879 [Chrysoperla carnea]
MPSLNDNNDFDNDDNSMRRKLRSSTRKSNDLIKNDQKSLSENKKCAKILSTTLQNENLNNRVSTRNMERMKNKKEFNDDDNAKIKIENIDEFNGEDKENNDENKENTLKRKCDEELFLQGEQGVIIDNMQNNNDYVKNLPVVPVKRGRKPKPKLPPNEIVLLCSEEYRFQCEKCAKVTRSIDDLIEHRQSDHGSNFDCKDCGQVVHSAKALMIHCRAHQSLKPFVCDQCGRSYSQTSHLWQHMRFHQGIKPFACPHEGCEARYTIRPDLKDHIRKVHTRERPFRCAVCGKCFLTGSVYYQHRLIHNNDRRYGCDMCGKRFFRADALNNHRRIHTDERPFPCPVCGREFRQKGDRNKHHRTQHPTEISLSNTISLHNQTI